MKLINATIIWLLLFSYAQAQGKPQGKEVISLNGNWLFAVDSTFTGDKENWQNGVPVNHQKKVIVPHTWNIDKGLEDYAGTAWYQKNIEIKKEWQQKRLVLKFNAVYHDAIVFVNGKKAGEHLNSGYTPFELDISLFANFGKSNSIIIKVSNDFSNKMFPYEKSFDWGNDGGIIRPVSLEILNRPSIKFVHTTPDLNLKDSSGRLEIAIKLYEESLKNATFHFIFKEKKSGKIVKNFHADLKSYNGIFSAEIDLGKVKPWHFDFPNLYTIETSLLSKGTISDIESTAFGFRKVEIKGQQLILNGEVVRLPGIEYMPGSNPNYGIAEPHRYMDSVVRNMKALHVCITRFHWQQDEYFLNLLDENGILVQEEMPWWQSPGNLTPELEDVARKQLSENIEAHYNHPSIFSWGISNEVGGNTDRSIYYRLRDFVKSLDESRFVTIVMNNIFETKKNDPSLIGDIPTWNEYLGTWFGANREELPGKLDTIKNVLDNRPLLITENGLCEPVFAGGDTRRIDDMIYHITEWQHRPFIIGYIYFCLNDYRTQMGEEGIGKYKIRRHGIMDLQLVPKPSFSVLKQVASPIEIISVKKSNETDAAVEIRVKNTIPSYTIRQYKIRYADNKNKWIEIALPDLLPGQNFKTILKNVNARYGFEIVNPQGIETIKY